MRRRRSLRGIALRRVVLLTAVLALLAALVGLAFAGSRSTLAAGTSIDGVPVGGLTTREASRVLSARAAAVASEPISFTAGGRSFSLSAAQLGVEADWRAAARMAAVEGGGFAPVRGFRRLHVRLFGAEIAAPLRASSAALDFKLDQIVAAVDRPSIDAKLERRGLSIAVVPGHPARRLDRAAAAEAIVRELGSLARGKPVALPVAAAAPKVRAADLQDAARRARTALSAPIRLVYGETRWRLPRWRIAGLLDLPSGGDTRVAIAGKGTEDYLDRLARTIGRKPQDARFQVTATGKIVIVPSKPGLELDRVATARALGGAAFSALDRIAGLAVSVAQPKRTTSVAKGMGITGLVAGYTTTYGGTPGRLHNVQLVSELIDGAMIAPGGTFSFNGTTGERSADKGFEEAPVIINGELQNGLGGGVCQVSTTVFNAAFEAGLPIDRRTNHALYISHYPLGRDATVNYPDIDLRFRNDTGKWLLLRTFVGSGSLTVNLYGTPVDRRVETETAPLAVVGAAPVKKVNDPTLPKGKRVLEVAGVPPRQTSVRRLVYDRDGKLLSDDTWRSYYVGEPGIVRVGTKRPAKKKQPKPVQDAGGRPGAEVLPGPVEPATPVPADVPAAPATRQ